MLLEKQALNARKFIDIGDTFRSKVAARRASGMALDRAVITTGHDFAPSARISDVNGWCEIKRNPLSKVGVFPYLGRSIGPEFEPDVMYNVLRPEEELNNPETINSFKLIPWIDDHEMLGPGFTPAEDKGIHGIVGEDVFYEDGYLYGNIKWFSADMDALIQSGAKKDLSAGYRCYYEKSSGIFNGQRYDAIQRGIRGNHLALVAEGRMGPDVAVMDHFNFTFDAKDIQMTKPNQAAAQTGKDESEGGEGAKRVLTPEELTEAIGGLMPLMDMVKELQKKFQPDPVDPDTGAEVIIGDETDEEKEDREKKEKAKKEKESMDARAKNAAMDAAQKQIAALAKSVADMQLNGEKALLGRIAQRDDLAQRLSPFIGAFDAREKTLQEVATYGLEKLGLKAAAGSEVAVLDGYLHDRKPPSALGGFGLSMDRSDGVNAGDAVITAYLTGKAA